MLTYEQAKAALLAGQAIMGAGDPDFRRKLGAVSFDGGLTWHASGGSSGFDGMSTLDGSYQCVVDAAPRDYRAERDALRLRLDDVLDELKSARLELKGERHDSTVWEMRAKAWGVRAEAAEAEVARLRERVAASELQLREVEESVSSLSGLVAHHMSLRAAREARDSRTAPKWPAVGETAQWTTVWDHLQAEPRARYKVTSSSAGYVLWWGKHNMRPTEMTVMSACSSDGSPNRWAEAGRECTRQSRSTFTRLPDAETP